MRITYNVVKINWKSNLVIKENMNAIIKIGKAEIREILRHSLNLKPLERLNKVGNLIINEVVSKNIINDTIEEESALEKPSLFIVDK